LTHSDPQFQVGCLCLLLSLQCAVAIVYISHKHLCLFFDAGILIEGIGSLLDGVMGTGNGTTSTSINVGVVGLTKVSHTV